MKKSADVKIKNSMGLHTRPATEIVKLLQKYKCQVFMTYKKETVNARSILGLLMLAVSQHSRVKITAEGEDAEKALDHLIQAFENKFGEEALLC